MVFIIQNKNQIQNIETIPFPRQKPPAVLSAASSSPSGGRRQGGARVSAGRRDQSDDK